jgi:DNA-binding phage protein
MKAAVFYEQGLDRDLQDPEFAAPYLTESFKSGKDVFLVALGDVVRARGEFKGFDESLFKDRAALYRGLGSSGNPRMDTLMLVLDKLGLGVSFAPTPRSVTRRRVRKPGA